MWNHGHLAKMQAPIDYAADYRRREAKRKAKREEYEREMREWEEKRFRSLFRPIHFLTFAALH